MRDELDDHERLQTEVTLLRDRIENLEQQLYEMRRDVEVLFMRTQRMIHVIQKLRQAFRPIKDAYNVLKRRTGKDNASSTRG